MTKPKELEDRVINFWKKEKIYKKTKKMRENKKKFYFLDGPPYATGYIHVGTAFNKILKDCFIRFFRMQGFNVWDQPGYDTHGVPIENKVEKNLGFKTKKDIEKFGIEKFVKECKNFATKFIDVMGSQFMNLGVWMDWKDPYLTLKNDYIEGAWFTFKKAFEKGFLYKGNYPVHVCSHCETAVAYNEIIYTQVTDPSIYVKFRLKDRPNEYILIWTTTPWTLPANTGVMVKPDGEYVKVKIDNETLILAKRLLETVMEKAGIKDYQVVKTFTGKDLEGMKYEHPLKDIFQFHSKLKDAFRVVLSDQFVTLDEGTGLVHTAPGHGQEDYKVGLETGLPAPSPVKTDGTFTDDCGKFSGMQVKDADKLILQELKDRGLLLHEEKITHEYPLCWRCETPLLLISVPQWFFKVTEIRDKLISENEKIKWVPSWAGQRFRNWLESLGDWPISRQRYWGIPLPIWICEKCENIKVVGSRNELPKVPEDFHRPFIDKITLKCDKCGGVMKRVLDVLDVWFDSGVASWASLGYPNDKKLFEKLWPADFILEGPDQIRGWWNSLMITSMMTFDKAPFKSVLFHGFVMDAHGKQMSKSLGNIVIPEDVIEKYGRDVLRFYYLSNQPWNDYYFKWKDIEDIAKKFIVIMNTFNFVKTYVPKLGSKNLKKEDMWILSRLNSVIENSTQTFLALNTYKTAQQIEDFILNDFSRWYVKLIRDRVWPEYDGEDKEGAFFTLFTVTDALSKLLAPFCPFLTENVYQDIIKPLRESHQSVHMEDWPKVDKDLINKKLEENMNIAKNIVEACYSARQEANIKLRWPVRQVIVLSDDEKTMEAAKELKEIMLRMCNSKKLEVLKTKPKGQFSEAEFSLGKVLVDKELGKELMEEALIKEVIRKVQGMRKKHSFEVKESISLTLNSDKTTNETIKKYVEMLKKKVGAKKIEIGKLKGEHKESLEFEKIKVEIAFEKY